ncbi:hypothetical protein M9H77_37034 [Catharanthus roseus]|uniref:Uncharacterized protein n=1 Tax=Catharanthus roseus TaxID=4058 RepID=A0ACB9ZVE6_CATRO|nr:hypothetical protein M9H77_37034 [Catharanthus roseus]
MISHAIRLSILSFGEVKYMFTAAEFVPNVIFWFLHSLYPCLPVALNESVRDQAWSISVMFPDPNPCCPFMKSAGNVGTSFTRKSEEERQSWVVITLGRPASMIAQ